MPWNRKDYPPDWEERRERILLRAGNKCELCGVENKSIGRWLRKIVGGLWKWTFATSGPWVEDFRIYHGNGMKKQAALRRAGCMEIVLTIMHLNHDKNNWDVKDEDLAAGCQRCHLNYDRPRHIANRKYGRDHNGKQQLKLEL